MFGMLASHSYFCASCREGPTHSRSRSRGCLGPAGQFKRGRARLSREVAREVSKEICHAD
eukprot:2964934-Alexandrium_andersonii.AAC.1